MNITQPAKEMLLESMKENKAQGIRFYFAGQGCCGPQFGLSMDAPEKSDVIKEVNGIQVALDERVSTMVDEVSLDFKNGGLVLEGLPESNC
ncbi:putative iron binding protein from the HesB_IscA_SufA family [Planococcus antarcticus DSM 14505]|uniref:Adhesin n=1 Tax=Planococcus antarcticus DSM 14505 TaxID=1185653 RepID=A0A1C7DHU7_9BACL|nr:iron-sulfur cluster biosynthesis family protein [Planococcus antarcticus]ANU11004.1 adhesin [Planococcus antarcticus DSM 14505]EIM07065.1 putative iron binding protein from the HesB_IscA_SufA family [Planococcus antarcticus DSM 14505]